MTRPSTGTKEFSDMKKENVCPGCGKHCPLSSPRCKYGMRYAAKLQKQKTPKKHKWEKHVTPDGPAHLMMTVSRKAKKALCHQKVNEDALFASFTPFEKEIFTTLLQKINTGSDVT